MTTSKSTKHRQIEYAKLNSVEKTDDASRNTLMAQVKDMYKIGGIRTSTQASSLLKLLTANNMKEFNKQFNTATETSKTLLAKRKAK